MTSTGNPGKDQAPLRGQIKSFERTGRGIEFRFDLENPNARPLHYVAEIRNIKFDPATGRLDLKMSDEGIEPIPGIALKQPRFGVIDPGAVQTIEMTLPPTIVQLGQPGPDGKLALVEHDISAAAEVNVVVGWSDTAYYPDTREERKDKPGAETWQRGALSLSLRPKAR